MVDKIAFADQIQIQANNIVLCERHNNKCKTFKLDSQDKNNIFKCHSCMIEEKQDYSQTVPLSQVCSYNNSTIILSWPPLDDQTLLQKVNQISKQSHSKQTECDKINEYFEQLTTQIIQKLNEKKKSILSQADNIADSSQSIHQVYLKIASLQELKEIIQDEKMKLTKKSELISNLILKKNTEKSQNTQLINQYLQEQNIPNFFDLNIFNQFKSSLISQIELIDYHNQTLIQDFNSFTQQFLSIQNRFDIPNQTMNIEIQKDSNLDRIIQMISNKSNSCSEKYLDSVKFELSKLQIIINNLNIEREQVFLPNRQQISIDFNHLENDQVDNIQILTEKMRILNQQYNQISNNDNKNILIQSIQPSSFLIFDKISKIQEINIQQKINIIQKLLRKYPIFEVEQIMKLTKYNFQIELSTFGKSQTNGKINTDSDGFQNFEVINTDGHAISFIRINQGCVYRIRIKMKLNNAQHFFIGFVKDISYIHDGNKINSFHPNPGNGDRGVSKVIKGKCLREVKYGEEYSEIEVRFCVKDRLFEVCDYPQRQNINTINDDRLNMIDHNSIYHLGLELYQACDKITILEFVEEKMVE